MISDFALISQESLTAFIQSHLSNGNLSVRAVERLCEIGNNSLIKGAGFVSQKLGQILMEQGYDAVELTESGFDAKATWLTIEYFAFESKAKAPGAKQIARTFGMLGVMAAFQHLEFKKESPQKLPPKRDTIEYIEAKKYLDNCNDPIFKSLAMQSLYEDLGAKSILPSENRQVPIAVLAREMGYQLKPREDIALGCFAKKHLDSTGKIPHGRYEVNTYLDDAKTRDCIHGFFR